MVALHDPPNSPQSESGMPHDRTFVVEALLGEPEVIVGRGSGKSKRQAEQAAAQEGLRHSILDTVPLQQAFMVAVDRDAKSQLQEVTQGVKLMPRCCSPLMMRQRYPWAAARISPAPPFWTCTRPIVCRGSAHQRGCGWVWHGEKQTPGRARSCTHGALG